jgi:hypothetical protein
MALINSGEPSDASQTHLDDRVGYAFGPAAQYGLGGHESLEAWATNSLTKSMRCSTDGQWNDDPEDHIQ